MAYIPSTDADLVQWGRNFSDLIFDAPVLYGLTAGDAGSIRTVYVNFNAAYEDAKDPLTRTRVQVAEKDGEKLTFLSVARAYAAIIRANRAVLDVNKVALGLTIADPTKTPIPVPATTPILNIAFCAVGIHVMNMSDILTPDKKAKPFGVAGALIYRTETTAPSIDPTLATVFALLTRSDQLISTSGLTKGKYANYWGQYYNRKGELGPLGDSTSFVIV